jgi:hypothetical protein
MSIELLTSENAHKLNPGSRVVWLMHSLGIRHQSHSLNDYERAKSYLVSWNLEPHEYDVAVRAITDYVQC